MGLDMYLHRKVYVGNKWKKPSEQVKINMAGVQQDRVFEIVEEFGYWRKANAIHNWFVENVQDGEDDCKEYYVSHEKLQELLDTVNKVLASCQLVKGKIANGYEIKDGKKVAILEDGMLVKNPKVAQELLPTQEGFFFGATDYDEYYVDDLKLTKEILERAVADKEGDFYYDSSW